MKKSYGRRISEMHLIEGADAIEVAKIDGRCQNLVNEIKQYAVVYREFEQLLKCYVEG